MEPSFKDARRASGMSIKEAARVCEVSAATYSAKREKDSDTFRVGELRKLYRGMTPIGKEMLMRAVTQKICS